tara:strand:- start:2777 stop:3109 length:333 start_codon:yes stop_codon:yes gene_type:complete
VSFFKSEQVQENLQDIFTTYQNVAVMTGRLGHMSKDQKFAHIDDCEELIEKQRIFYTRLCLAASTDPEASDMKGRINAMSQAFGFTDLGACMDAMVSTLNDARNKELDSL